MIEVNNITRAEIDEEFLVQVAKNVLTGENRKKSDLSIALVGPKRMRELNKRYRKKDKVVNVLSFPFDSAQGKPLAELGLGEIVLCVQEVKKDAKKYGMIFEKALAWMLVHGILHLLGYDHAKERDAKHMEQKEHLYLSRL